MGRPVSVRLDERHQATLEEAARARGIGLSTYLRELAEKEADRVWREKVREQSRLIGEAVARDPEVRAFYEDWGSAIKDLDWK
ncbi:MAG TPA: hypothetical protein VED40_06675 [Azospirillaceae bacterium]|nr:hypothetical protein [Azospirillaceae bacterium]